MITTLEELDAELTRLDGATYEEQKQIFASFAMRVDRPGDLDPRSPEYRDRELKLYEWLSAKRYVAENEVVPLDVNVMSRRPFPYFTRSPLAVGDQLMAIGFLIKALALEPGASVLEFGCGWGNLTIQLARMDYEVTAVDIAPDFLAIVAERARQEECNIKLIEGDFAVAHEIDERFDAVVFYASFHHCEDPFALIKRLPHLLRPGGKVAFAAEPITDDLDVPWGLRLDGESLWAIHRNGWLETGFTKAFFYELLEEDGWKLEERFLPESAWGQLYLATRA